MEFRIASLTDENAIISFDCVAASDPARVQFIQEQISTSNCYVAIIEGVVVAYAVLNYNFFGNGWIEMLYVDGKFRRQGVGCALLGYLISICSKPKLFTSTNQSNIPMQRLLETLQFAQSGYIENLDDGDPELVYFKLLS